MCTLLGMKASLLEFFQMIIHEDIVTGTFEKENQWCNFVDKMKTPRSKCSTVGKSRRLLFYLTEKYCVNETSNHSTYGSLGINA